MPSESSKNVTPKNATPKNANRFVIFSVFFTARAYYPILAILFLDLGLSLDQFVLLNLLWAATIFLFEVPSGALADTIGRRRLLIAASCLMLIEMLCLLLAPRDGGTLLLALCIINRICSGLSEACASGADEAFAYDSLPEEGRAQAWDKLLVKVMRWRSAGFVIAMMIGGVLYDPDILNYLLPAEHHLSANLIHRLPIALVFFQALICLVITLRMSEPNQPQNKNSPLILVSTNNQIKSAFQLTLKTTRWVFTHPILLVALLIGVAMDSIVRNFATINSSYFRFIDLPEWTYGFISAGIGVISWFVPGIAEKLNKQFSMLTIFGLTALGIAFGLAALIPLWPIWGIIPAALLMTMMGLLSFTLSRVLHQEADSSQRATVLSVKGLVFNLGYGLFSLGFSGLLAISHDDSASASLSNALFWQLPYFILLIISLFFWSGIYLNKKPPK